MTILNSHQKCRTSGPRALTTGATVLAVSVIMVGAMLQSLSAQAGDLAYFEQSMAPGMPRVVAAPATNVAIGIDYSPASAEGGGFYGMSEVTFVATGDVTIDPGSIVCHAAGCLWTSSPLAPYDDAPEVIQLIAGDDLLGEFTGSADLLSLRISGTSGHLAIVSGQYIDASGAGSNLGAIQDVDSTILATVPEPSLSVGFGLGALALLLGARRHSRYVRS